MCLCYGQDEKGLPPTPNTLHLGCTYHLHTSHRFLSTWGAVTMLEKQIQKNLAWPTYLAGPEWHPQHVHAELRDWFCPSVSLQVSNGDLDGFTLVHQNVPESRLKQLAHAFPSFFMFLCKDGKVYAGSVNELVCEKFLVDCEQKKILPCK